MTVGADVLYEEIAFLAYYLHWSHDDILDLEHPVRRRYANEVGHINARINEES